MSTQVREHPVLDVRRAKRARKFAVSPAEVMAALAAVAAVTTVIIYYATSLKPERQRAIDAENRLKDQEKTLIEHRLSDKSNDGGGDSSGLAKGSLAEFNEKWLKPLGQGRIALIDDINALTRKNGVQLISGIEMQSGADSDNSTEKRERKKKVEDILSVYPKLEIQFSVFGPYHSLRTFVKELEENKQFLVIQQISLTSVEEAKGGGPRVGRGAMSGAGVALSINATCYFRP